MLKRKFQNVTSSTTFTFYFQFVTIITLIPYQCALDNNLVLTPPMGWLAWERFKCNIDCENYPNECISENLFMAMADRLVEDGYKDAGYDRINIDDCWMLPQRDERGKQQNDPVRFKMGIKALAKFMHDKGLKLGIYGAYGTHTCMGYPGMQDNLQLDADTFAEWNVDMLKLDGCHSSPSKLDLGYPEMQHCLNRTGKSIVFSCSWPYYQMIANMEPDYKKIVKHCNLWRNFHDITASWNSIKSVIDFYGDNQEVLVPLAGPGHWNDPDMIVIGNNGLSYDQSVVQMGMWAILAAPLLMSNDLRTVSPEFRDILLNKDAIAINQDYLGIQGKRIYQNFQDGIEIWARPISPLRTDRYSFAIAILNTNQGLPAKKISFQLAMLGLTFENGYQVRHAFAKQDLGLCSPSTNLSFVVRSTGLVLLRANLNII